MSDLRAGTLRMPAAPLGPDNPLPPLSPPQTAAKEIEFDESVPHADREHFGYGRVSGCLPHCLQDDYGRTRAPREFKVAVLENETLRATVLLEFGGRMWSLFHKPSGRELLYVNPVFQPANLAVRNAWFSGGVEWNVGVAGHTPYTCSPLFAARVDGEGGPILRLYEWDRIRETPYQLDLSLPDGSEMLLVRVRLINPHRHEIPMYWWSNIAAPERPDVRVLSPVTRAFHHGYDGRVHLVPVPVSGGVDVTYPTNISTSADYFWYVDPGRRPWIASLDADGRGLVQTSTSRLIGRKLFVWGMGPGGRRWQDFLSTPGHPYIELQAGLTRTQQECLPMPPGAEWSWLEAYGPLQADPSAVHGADWAAACAAVESQLDQMLPCQWLEDELARTEAQADRPPREMLHRGSGWGALERRRREALGEEPFCPPGLDFDDASLGADQAPWLALLRGGALPRAEPSDPPGAWMVQREWRGLLERALERNRGDHWLSWLHLGVMLHHAGEREKAKRAWERSIRREPSALAYRNLAVAASHEGRLAEAADLWLEACRMAPDLVPLAVECCACLAEAGRAGELTAVLARLAPETRAHPRLRVLEARAALETGDLETVERILLGEVELTDLREGETTLTDLWYRMHEKRVAAAENLPEGKELRDRVRREFPPPAHIDFRMSAPAQ